MGDVASGREAQAAKAITTQVRLHLGAQVAGSQGAHRGDCVANQREGAAHAVGQPQRRRGQRQAFAAASFQFVVRKVAECQQQVLGHPRSKTLVAVPVGNLLTGEHAVVVGGNFVGLFAELRIGGIQVNLAVIRALYKDHDLFESGELPIAWDDNIPDNPETLHDEYWPNDLQPFFDHTDDIIWFSLDGFFNFPNGNLGPFVTFRPTSTGSVEVQLELDDETPPLMSDDDRKIVDNVPYYVYPDFLALSQANFLEGQICRPWSPPVAPCYHPTNGTTNWNCHGMSYHAAIGKYGPTAYAPDLYVLGLYGYTCVWSEAYNLRDENNNPRPIPISPRRRDIFVLNGEGHSVTFIGGPPDSFFMANKPELAPGDPFFAPHGGEALFGLLTWEQICLLEGEDENHNRSYKYNTLNLILRGPYL